ncbi:MAG: YeeE/YedE thiosulfate transporter family protein [Planctomycetota bacterium]
MAVIAPFFKFGAFGDEVSLVVAFVTGIAFGFTLERAGFGNARVLAAQFYFRDLRVLKVMFTAIVTAMIGTFLLGRLGVLDLSLVYLTPTFLVPQIVGGLVLGAGFIIGGYCPGTSCVSAATGRVDGMVYLLGMIGGLVGFAEIYPGIQGWLRTTPLGQVTLAQQFGLPYGMVVAAVAVMALGAFLAAEWAERRIGGKLPGPGSLLEPVRRITPVRAFALALLGLGLVAPFAGDPYRRGVAQLDAKQLALEAGTKADHVWPTELADWILQGRNDYRLIDVREPDEFATYHIPGAVNVPLTRVATDLAQRNELLVFVSDGGIHAAQAWLLFKAMGYRSVYMLFGGIEEWKEKVLFPVAPAADAPTSEQVEFRKRAAVAKYFGGAALGAGSAQAATRIVPPMPTSPPGDVVPAPARKKKKEGC